MNELVFFGLLILIVFGGLLLVKWAANRRTGRKANHPVYHESSARKPRHRPAAHSLVHSHSSKSLYAKDDIWRSSRIKTGETQWQPGVMVANKILTDSELALEEREPEQGHGMPSVDYSPTETPKQSPRKTTGRVGTRRG